MECGGSCVLTRLHALVGVIMERDTEKGRDHGRPSGRIHLLACVMHSRKHGFCGYLCGKSPTGWERTHESEHSKETVQWLTAWHRMNNKRTHTHTHTQTHTHTHISLHFVLKCTTTLMLTAITVILNHKGQRWEGMNNDDNAAPNINGEHFPAHGSLRWTF